MKMISRTIAGLGLVAAFASVGQAQFLTDAGSPMGSGAGVTGSVVSYVGGVNATTVSLVSQFVASRGVNAAVRSAGEALGGNPTALSSFLSGVTGGGALAQALVALGSNPTPAAAVDAIRAFNAAVDGGAQPGSPAHFALRGAQSVLMMIGARTVR
jgi:hypothetical protein